jgi:hypothetical protein
MRAHSFWRSDDREGGITKDTGGQRTAFFSGELIE